VGGPRENVTQERSVAIALRSPEQRKLPKKSNPDSASVVFGELVEFSLMPDALDSRTNCVFFRDLLRHQGGREVVKRDSLDEQQSPAQRARPGIGRRRA
jgi:hypothetical protein